jgi:PLP dependent protein
MAISVPRVVMGSNEEVRGGHPNAESLTGLRSTRNAKNVRIVILSTRDAFLTHATLLMCFVMAANNIRENNLRVRERVAAAALKAGRSADEITLIAVSKTHPASAIQEAYDAGLRHFGENRVQEWEGKHGALQSLDATWHLIGHLQSNKAAKAARIFTSIDSLDDESLGRRLDRLLAETPNAPPLRVLIEVHLGGEESKTGVPEENLRPLAETIQTLPHLSLAGLMCIPPFYENTDEVRPHFAHLRELRDQLASALKHPLPVLSMGMSHDFEAAILEGSTEVRIGTAIFGIRPPVS